jgi:hypothetical protein
MARVDEMDSRLYDMHRHAVSKATVAPRRMFMADRISIIKAYS